MNAATGKKLTLAARRDTWLDEIGRSITEHSTWTDYAEGLYRIRVEGPAMGRTEKWRRALRWFDERLAEGSEIDWIFLQGVVYLSHAA